ncbi:hypothetical protein ACVWY2_008688 [Bradyrhizobium sp. JR6.1]
MSETGKPLRIYLAFETPRGGRPTARCGPPQRQIRHHIGAGSGIGRAATLLFAKEGAQLIAVGRTEAVADIVGEVKKTGGLPKCRDSECGFGKGRVSVSKRISSLGSIRLLLKLSSVHFR